jgi:hypothetical protein
LEKGAGISTYFQRGKPFSGRVWGPHKNIRRAACRPQVEDPRSKGINFNEFESRGLHKKNAVAISNFGTNFAFVKDKRQPRKPVRNG